MTNLYFAICGSPDINIATFTEWDWANKPLNILAAFPRFVNVWKKVNKDWPTKSLMLDSGAYSAWNSGQVIDINVLCEEAKNPCWDLVVGLDVIGDGAATLKNVLYMKELGLNIIPVFHYGEPWEFLLEYKNQFKYIGLGGRPQKKDVRDRWLEQCFARAYPHRIHLFGCGEMKLLSKFPFTSADTASWHTPAGWGASQATPGLRRPRKSEAGASVYDLRAEIHYYLDVEAKVQDRWSKELAWTKDAAA
jgi:hypothetical protein